MSKRWQVFPQIHILPHSVRPARRHADIAIIGQRAFDIHHKTLGAVAGNDIETSVNCHIAVIHPN
jgi:hypothetical protein